MRFDYRAWIGFRPIRESHSRSSARLSHSKSMAHTGSPAMMPLSTPGRTPVFFRGRSPLSSEFKRNRQRDRMRPRMLANRYRQRSPTLRWNSAMGRQRSSVPCARFSTKRQTTGTTHRSSDTRASSNSSPPHSLARVLRLNFRRTTTSPPFLKTPHDDPPRWTTT